MATIKKEPEKWMSKETFDNLDLSQVPVGTVINVVDTEYHRWKIEVDGGVNYGLLTFYFDTPANNLTELANALVEEKTLLGKMFALKEDWYSENNVIGVVIIEISAVAISSNNLSITGRGNTFYSFNNQISMSNILDIGTATVTQLY